MSRPRLVPLPGDRWHIVVPLVGGSWACEIVSGPRPLARARVRDLRRMTAAGVIGAPRKERAPCPELRAMRAAGPLLSERSVQEWLSLQLELTGMTVVHNVKCEAGIADMVACDEVIECKHTLCGYPLMSAVGQANMYGLALGLRPAIAGIAGVVCADDNGRPFQGVDDAATLLRVYAIWSDVREEWFK